MVLESTETLEDWIGAAPNLELGVDEAREFIEGAEDGDRPLLRIHLNARTSTFSPNVKDEPRPRPA